mmetsp:Transcript_50524/g.131455  ORF Transcript_50524/g.131455 Transcript_50524/m.131455 type:complete len:238 (-) Transcript_50524:472-1185(-)
MVHASQRIRPASLSLNWRSRPGAAKPKVRRTSICRILRARLHAIAVAVRLVAHVRAAFFRALACCHGPVRVDERRRALGCPRVLDAPVVVHPLPDVADQVVEAEGILRTEGVHRSSARVPVVAAVGSWKGALPHVGPVHTLRCEHISPWVLSTLLSSASSSCKFPLRFSWKAPIGWVGPRAVSHGIIPRDMHHWVVGTLGSKCVRAWPIRMAPARSIHLDPPRGSVNGIRRCQVGLL